MRWQRSSRKPGPETLKRRHALLGAGLAIVLAIVLGAWALIDGNDSPSSTSAPSASTEAKVLSVEDLRSAADETAIYWAGPPDGSELELSQPSADRAYVRYLTGGAEAGDPRPFLTVGSYSLPNPAAALRRQGEQADGVLAKTSNGGVVYFSRAQPKSVYLAYPGINTEVEVFARSFEQALQLVTSGRIVPIE